MTVKCLSSEVELRFREWIEARRARVDDGNERPRRLHLRAEHRHRRAERAGAAVHGAVVAKDGLIVDERFNSGGQIPDRFIELLNRPMLAYWAVRHGEHGSGRRWRTAGRR